MAANFERQGPVTRGNPLRWLVWGTAACLLLLPAIAMQFTDEVDWDETDFIVMGTILAVTCGIYEFATKVSGDRWYRAATGWSVVFGFLLVWANLAVGIVGDGGNPVNLAFFGVLLVGILGAFIARFEARGMVRVMLAMGIAQAVLVVPCLRAGSMEGVVTCVVYIGVWAIAAALFARAGRALTA